MGRSLWLDLCLLIKGFFCKFIKIWVLILACPKVVTDLKYAWYYPLVFHAWMYGRFIKIQSYFRRKKLHRKNQGSNFLEGSFTNRDNVRDPIQFRIESQPQHFKRYFPSRTDPSIFTSIAPVLLDYSNKTTWVFPALKSTSHFLL